MLFVGHMPYFLILLLSFFLSSLQMSWAQNSEGLRINGDSFSRDAETKTVTVEGNVEIVIQDQKLSCKKASVNFQKNEIIAEGDVLLESPTTSIQATRMTYNYKTKVGKIENGFVQSGQVVFEGQSVEKTGENTYIAKGARYTSCTTCPAAWSFTGSEIDAEMGGYAYIKYPVLRVADFPIFILPRLLIPLKSERQSGLLVPSFKISSKSGLAISQEVFWAIDKSQDALFTISHSDKRGQKYNLEHRYLLSANSKGNFRAGYLNDKVFTEDGRTNSSSEEKERSFFSYKHHYELPQNMIQKVDFNIPSDLRYVRDFSDDLGGHGDPALENKMSLSQNADSTHRSIEAVYYLNLLEADSEASNDRSVHRFPEINYNLTQRQIGQTGAFFKFDFNYVNFSRRDFSYDDVTGTGTSKTVKAENDGQYDPATDIIRTGHRAIFAPSVSYPFQVARRFDVVPSFTYNEAQYRFNATADAACPSESECGQNAVQRYLQTDLAVRTKFYGIYGNDNKVSNLYKHEVVPEIIFSTIPWSDRPSHIFFGDFDDQPYSRRAEQVTNEDFFGTSKLQFDYKDRLFDKRLATFILSNHVIRKRYSSDVSSYNKLATFRLKQSYDFNEADEKDPRPWSPINGLIDYRGEKFETHTVGDYYPYSKVTNWSTRLRYTTQLKNYLELTYTQEKFVDEDASSGITKEIENYGVGTGFILKYFNFGGRANFSVASNRFEGWEYSALIKFPGDCWGLLVEQKEPVGSELETEIKLKFEFGGQI